MPKDFELDTTFKSSDESSGSTEIRQEIVNIYIAWMTALTAVTIACMYVVVEYLQWSEWLSAIWLLGAGDSGGNQGVLGVHSFTDLSLNMAWASSSSPYLSLASDGSLSPSNYPPFVHTFLSLFQNLDYSLAVFFLTVTTLLMVSIPVLIALQEFSISQKSTILVAGFVFTYPMLMILDRGNLQGIVTGCCLFAIMLMSRGRYLESAVLLGIAAALKIYPGIYFLVFLKQRRFKELSLAITTTVLLTVVSVSTFTGTWAENFAGFKLGLRAFTGDIADANIHALLFQNHSLLALISYVSLQDVKFFSSAALLSITFYQFLILTTGTLVVLWILFSKYQNENQVLLSLTTAIVLIPSISYGYALSMFFIVLLNLFDRKTDLSKFSITYVKVTLVLIALLFAAKGFPLNVALSSWMNILDPIILLLLLIVSFIKFQPRKVMEKHEFNQQS